MAKQRKVGNPAIVDTQRQGMTNLATGREYAAGNGNGRQVAGTAYAYSKVDDPSAKDFALGLLVRRDKGGAVGAPAPATAMHRQGEMQDRLGPRFAIKVALPGPMAPEASDTQRNTRFVPPAINRSLPNFNMGRMS